MASESALWNWLSGAGEKPRPGLHMQRVENPLTAAGPDVEGQFHEAHFHVELKVLHDGGHRGTPEETGRLKFRVGQREWSRRRWEVGGIAYLLIEGFDGVLYLIPGAFAMALEKIGTVKTGELRSLAIWTKKRSPETRDTLFDVLRRPTEARERVALRLQRDQRLREASLRDGGLAQALGSLPVA